MILSNKEVEAIHLKALVASTHQVQSLCESHRKLKRHLGRLIAAAKLLDHSDGGRTPAVRHVIELAAEIESEVSK